MAPTDLSGRAWTLPVLSVLLIGVGGFFGAVTRYLIDARVSAWTGGTLPWGTFVINISGSLIADGLITLESVEAVVYRAR
jgi:CrcB protein